MVEKMKDLLENVKIYRRCQARLKNFRRKSLRHPDDLLIKVRIGDSLAKLKKRKEAVAVYEETAMEFMEKNLFAHAIALKKVIFRLDPPKDERDREEILAGIYRRMQMYQEQARTNA